MSHTVTITFDELGYHPSYSMACTEPTQSVCHADWDCSCEYFGEAGDENGRPWHETCYGDGEIHYGTYDPTDCNVKNWFDNTEDLSECIKGRVSFDVEPEWQGEWLEYHVTNTAPEGHVKCIDPNKLAEVIELVHLGRLARSRATNRAVVEAILAALPELIKEET